MIKGTTKTLKKAKMDSKCNKETQAKFEIEWHYTTNVSGNHTFVYTGKELGKDYYDPGEQKKIYVGDTVIYKKKDHLNDGVRAIVKEYQNRYAYPIDNKSKKIFNLLKALK